MNSVRRYLSLCRNWCRPLYDALSRVDAGLLGLGTEEHVTIGSYAVVRIRIGFVRIPVGSLSNWTPRVLAEHCSPERLF